MGSRTLKLVYVAGAGTGKTRLLSNIAVERCANHKVLYLTYTDANAAEFSRSIAKRVGHIPESITVMTWFSFLLTHGVRPFPANGFAHRIDGILFNNERPRTRSGVTRGSESYYCPLPGIVYRTRLSDLAMLCDEQWGGEMVRRVCSIFGTILVDEAQDFAGYDYDLLLSLMDGSKEMVIVGDPRQQTYRTVEKTKNRSYATVFDFFKNKSEYLVDSTTLSVTHRCSTEVIELSNRLYNEYPRVTASEERTRNPRGHVEIVRRSDFEKWDTSKRSGLTALVWNSRTRVPDDCRVMNMGESKGLTLGDVAIFPTAEMKKWFSGKPADLKGETKAKLYVAITRASGDLYIVL